MNDEDSYDNDLDVDYTPSGDELTELSQRNLSQWLEYVQSDPPLHELRTKANAIMTDIQIASGLTGVETLAADLALAVDSKFVRLGLWRAWYTQLMNLYAPLVDQIDEALQACLFQMLMHYYLHQGDVMRANQAIKALMDLADTKPEIGLKEAMLGAAAVSASLTDSEGGLALAEQLLDLSQLTDDKVLMGRTFGVLAQFYANRGDLQQTFECGQMTYCVGLGLAEDVFIIHGLHYMALALTLGSQPERAIPYLEWAAERSCWSGDSVQRDYLWYTWGLCSYLMGKYEDAEALLSECVRTFAGRGKYYAKATYMCALVQMKLGHLREAERLLRRSISEWERLKRPFDRLYAEHGLAHLYWLDGRCAEAVEMAEQTLAEAQASDNLRRDALVSELRQDLDKYRASLGVSGAS
jgi:tetratricopeptide (TPR) repeat protein